MPEDVANAWLAFQGNTREYQGLNVAVDRSLGDLQILREFASGNNPASPQQKHKLEQSFGAMHLRG